MRRKQNNEFYFYQLTQLKTVTETSYCYFVFVYQLKLGIHHVNHQVLLAVAEVVAPVLVLVPISTIMFVVRDSMNIIMCLDGHLFLNVQIVQ